MCGRFTLTAPGEDLALHFNLDEVPVIEARYNIAPTQPVLMIRQEKGRRVAEMARWGLIPSWSKDGSAAARMINARAETVAEKPAFRAAFRQRRCLIPADGFYEWQARPRGKQAYYARLATGKLFAMAGLWEHWQAPDGAWIQSCTILTTTANELLQPLHDRMPVILAPEHYPLWLDPSVHDAGPLQALLGPYPAECMRVYPVGPAVNSVRNDGPGLIEPLDRARL
ncbi:MAG: SOS response-associated peptidase [Oscillochloridaceae bacterium]|nr:SOS response-associated peptidase [Chloroflexaceae bacterium]MDW8390534.1 SOS response-associated peptidase [Oscillochloridaceae bacterium]